MLLSKELIVVDATCPFVSKIHEKVKKYSKLGYDIVIVGDKSHPEVIGINGWCDNKAVISKQGEGLENIGSKVCIVSQTTEKAENWEKVLSKVKDEKEKYCALIQYVVLHQNGKGLPMSFLKK